jgi:hypothetical protein
MAKKVVSARDTESLAAFHAARKILDRLIDDSPPMPQGATELTGFEVIVSVAGAKIDKQANFTRSECIRAELALAFVLARLSAGKRNEAIAELRSLVAAVEREDEQASAKIKELETLIADLKQNALRIGDKAVNGPTRVTAIGEASVRKAA